MRLTAQKITIQINLKLCSHKNIIGQNKFDQSKYSLLCTTTVYLISQNRDIQSKIKTNLLDQCEMAQYISRAFQ